MPQRRCKNVQTPSEQTFFRRSTYDDVRTGYKSNKCQVGNICLKCNDVKFRFVCLFNWLLCNATGFLNKKFRNICSRVWKGLNERTKFNPGGNRLSDLWNNIYMFANTNKLNARILSLNVVPVRQTSHFLVSYDVNGWKRIYKWCKCKNCSKSYNTRCYWLYPHYVKHKLLFLKFHLPMLKAALVIWKTQIVRMIIAKIFRYLNL